MGKGKKDAAQAGESEPSYPTSDARLRYVRVARGHYRFVQVGTGRLVGGHYRSERELLAAVADFGKQLERWLKRNPPGDAGRRRR